MPAYDGPPTTTGGRPLEPEPPQRVGALTPSPIPDPLLQLSDAAAVTRVSAKRSVRYIKTDTSAAPAVRRQDQQSPRASHSGVTALPAEGYDRRARALAPQD